MRNEYRRLSVKLRRKLRNLIEHSDWTKDANHEFVVNLSNKPLQSDAVSALGYGISFSITNRNINIVEIANSFYNLERYGDLPPEDIGICKGIVYGSMSKPNYCNVPLRFIKALRDLKNDVGLHITKADKSNVFVIMNKNDYVNKMSNLLSDVNTYCELTRNPLESVNSNFNRKLKLILKGQDELIKQFSSQCASLPYMYGLIKTHKPNNPVRPIISSVGTITYKLSKWLVKVLMPIVGTISNSNIKDNVDFVNKLNMSISYDFKIVSFDVTSLFTKAPVDDLLSFLSEV